MTITPAEGYMVDPTNSNGVVKIPDPAKLALNTQQAKGGAQAGAQVSNQGKPGFDVFGNPVIDTQKKIEPTVISGDKSQTIADNAQKITTLQNNGLTVGADGLARYSDASFAEAPSDAIQDPETGTWRSGGVSYALGPATTMSPEDKQSQDLLSSIKTQTDAAFAGQISAIKSQYDSLIKQQTDTNARQSASVDQSLLMGGSSRYAQLNATGVSTTQINYGISQLADLQNKENMAIATATSAQASADYELAGKQLALIQDIKEQKQKVAQALSEKLTKQAEEIKKKNDQSKIDMGVGAQLTNGITDPQAILKALQDAGIPATAKDVADSIANLNPDAKDVHSIMLEAAKNGAPKDTITNIGKAKSVTDAIAAAGESLQSATGTLGDYLQYKRDTEAKGLVPKDFETYKDDQDAKALKQKVSEAYAVQNAKNQSDANFTASDKTQQRLEQQYRQVLSKEFSSRTGALGIENAKVNQANHLNSLFTQYYDPKTKTYNVPKTQYAELAIGLANLVSPSGTVTEGARDAIMQKTAKGDFNGAIAYITGTPQNGTTQEVIKNLIDSVDRQAETAARNREAALQNMRDQAPTDLEQSRIDKLNKSTEMVKYEGQDRISKSTVDSYIKANPTEAENIAKLYEIPGATDKDIEDYLRANGKIQ